MAILPETLQHDPQYRLVEVLPHSDIVKFVQAHSKPNNWISIGYWGFNVVVLMYSFGRSFYDVRYRAYELGTELLAGLGLGFFLAILVAFLIHENIHLLAYKILGAPQATIKVDVRRLVLLAIADRFVLGSRGFYFLAVLPFALITSGLLVGLLLTAGYWHYVCLGILLLHTGGCSGDFALMAYFYTNRHRRLLTYDDEATSTTYFYERISTGPVSSTHPNP